jgi:anti-sigma factor RsiW
MPRAKCPDPALLQAYVDGTLFSRDVSAVEQHIASCERCAGILSAMRKARDAVAAPKWPASRVTGVALAVIAVAGVATWAVRSGSNDAAPPPPAPSPAAEKPAPAPAPSPTPVPAPEPKAATPPPSRPAPPVADRRQPPAETSPANDAASADGGVILRGGRRSNRRVMWRARDLAIEHSTDDGTTWTSEYTTDRRVRAGVFVSADAAWFVGDSGLVLRRTRNGWFGTTPPAEGNIKGIRASSTSKATVTFEDGRVFTTENGGVTWSLDP